MEPVGVYEAEKYALLFLHLEFNNKKSGIDVFFQKKVLFHSEISD